MIEIIWFQHSVEHKFQLQIDNVTRTHSISLLYINNTLQWFGNGLSDFGYFPVASTETTSQMIEIGEWLARSGMFLECAFPMLAGTMNRVHKIGLQHLRLCSKTGKHRGEADFMATRCGLENVEVLHPVKLGSKKWTNKEWTVRLEQWDKWFGKMVDGFVKY